MFGERTSRLISIFVTVVLVCGLMPVKAFADSPCLQAAQVPQPDARVLIESIGEHGGVSEVSGVASVRVSVSSLSDAARAAYRAKLEEYISEYGEPSSYRPYSWSKKMAKGVGYADLLDVDGDGAVELLVAFGSKDSSTSMGCDSFEIWDYRNGAVFCILHERLSGHGTNGWFPFVELHKRQDKSGYLYMKHGCLGSSPIIFTEEIFGLSGSTFLVYSFCHFSRSGRALSL